MCRKNWIKCCIFMTVLGLSGLSHSHAAIDWNWPQGQIPSNPREIDRAMSFYQNGEIDSAIITLNGIKGSQDCRARHILADIYRESGRYSDAKRELLDIATIESQFIANNTARPSWMDPLSIKLELGETALQEGQPQEALSIFREVQQASPNMTQARTSIARVYETMGEVEQARNQYKSIIDSGIPLYTSEKSQILERITQLEKHMEEEHIRQRDQQKAGHGNNQPQGAQPGQPGHPGNDPGLAQAQQPHQMHQVQTAPYPANPYDHATAYAHGEPGAPGAYPGGPGHSQYSHQGQSSNHHVDKARTAESSKMGPLQWAMEEISQKKYDDAIIRLKIALKEAPQNAQVHYLLAIAYAHTGKFSEAKSEYQEVLKHAQNTKLKTLAQDGLSKIQNKN